MTTPMPISAADLQPLLPELTLIAGAFALLMLDLFLDNARRFITHALALVVMVAVVWMLLVNDLSVGAFLLEQSDEWATQRAR